MSLVSGSLVFIVVWWVVLFMVLPFGYRKDTNPEIGLEPGAPQNPQIAKKFLVTTLITMIIWTLIYITLSNHTIIFA